MKVHKSLIAFLVVLVAVAIVLVTYLVLGYVGEDDVQWNTDVSGVKQVIVQGQAADDLMNQWQIRNTEWIYCANGVRDGDMFIVESGRFTQQWNGTGVKVSYAACNAHISIHPHLNGNCHPSSQDYYTFGGSKEQYIGIMCRNDLVAVYSSDELEKPYKVILKWSGSTSLVE